MAVSASSEWFDHSGEDVQRGGQAKRKSCELEVVWTESELQELPVRRGDWHVEEGILEVKRGGPSAFCHGMWSPS